MLSPLKPHLKGGRIDVSRKNGKPLLVVVKNGKKTLSIGKALYPPVELAVIEGKFSSCNSDTISSGGDTEKTTICSGKERK